MTRENIEKSLECCSYDGNACSKCRVSKKLQADCKCGQTLVKEALNYIEQLKEEKNQAFADGQKEVLQDMYNVTKQSKDKTILVDCNDIIKIARRYGIELDVKNE